MGKIKWGILATGGIANSFCEALNQTEDAEIAAVASRSIEKAKTFASKWNINRCFGDYRELADDPEIDIIYIATPHSFHYENMLMCLERGKYVLCEKAFTLNAPQAAECVNLARQKNLFLMEAMWMRYFPAIDQVLKWIEQNFIGKVRLIKADFFIDVPFDPMHRLYDMNKGGGALLDLGIYPLSLSTFLLGLPTQVLGNAQKNQTGADELDNITLLYKNGVRALLGCGQRVYKPHEAFILGSKGYIKIHHPFFRPDKLTV